MKKLYSTIMMLAMMVAALSFASSCNNKSKAQEVDSEITDSETPDFIRESLNKILLRLIPENGDEVDKSEFFTIGFNTYFKRACEKANREGYELPRLWWAYSDSDPEKFTIENLKKTSDVEAEAKVKLSSELYIGRFNIKLKKEESKWLIDEITETETKNNPESDTSEDDSGEYASSSSGNIVSQENHIFINVQYIIGHLLNQRFVHSSGLEIRFDGDGRMYIDGDAAGVISVVRHNSESAILRYGNGMYGEGTLFMQYANGKIQLTDTSDGSVFYQK